ncbi:unnamed protein product [Tilletia controversa]|nr:unnamed protein product [Tilletia controversa]
MKLHSPVRGFPSQRARTQIYDPTSNFYVRTTPTFVNTIISSIASFRIVEHRLVSIRSQLQQKPFIPFLLLVCHI